MEATIADHNQAQPGRTQGTELMDRIKDVLRRAEASLDRWGRPGWIAAMVLGFILVWPLGLAILFYMIWSGRMSGNCKSRWSRRSHGDAYAPTGNAAFDAYRADTLRRLEEEQVAFEAFLTRLREAKDKAEFDQFMTDRRHRDDAGGAPIPS